MINFVGIGAQKAATTWIFQMLDSHPDTCLAKSKEVHYFNKHFDKGADWYESKFTHCENERVVGEISTSYLSGVSVPERIYQYNSEIKIIVSLRDPVKRAMSHINHLHSKNKISTDAKLQTVLDKYPEVVDNGMYGKHLERYLEFFDREQIMIVKFTDIKDFPESVIRNIYDFLGIDTSFVPNDLKEKYNTARERSSFIFRFSERVYQKMKQSRLGKAILDGLRKFGVNHTAVKRVLRSTPSRQQIELSGEDKKHLESFFVEDQEILKDKFGIHL